MEALYAKVNKAQGRLNEISRLIDNRKNGRKAAGAPSQGIRNKLVELRQEFNTTLNQKKAIRAQLTAVENAREALREEAKSFKQKLSFVNVKQIDSEIASIESHIAHSTLSLVEEKKLVNQIKELRNSRDYVKEYNERLDKMNEDEGLRSEYRKQIGELDTKLNEIKAQENEQRSKLDEVKSKEQAAASDMPSLLDERSKLQEEMRAARDAVRELRGEFKKKEDEYYNREREIRKQQKEEYEKRRAEQAEERKQRDEERRRRQLENAPEPRYKEIMACEQLIAYIGKVDPRPSAAASEKAAAAEPASAAPTPETMEGGKKGQVFQVLKKNDDDDLEGGMFGGMGGGKKKKKGKAAKPEPTLEEKLKAKMGSHSMDILASFALVKVTPPLTVGDAVTTSVEALKARLESYKARQIKEKEKRQKIIAEGGDLPASGNVSANLSVEGDDVKVELTVAQ